MTPHRDIAAAARLLHLLARQYGSREVTLSVGCDGRCEIRYEDARGYHQFTERFEATDDRSVER